MREYFVYIAASPSRTVYIGITNDLERRIYEHKQKVFKGFTASYGINRLVYMEEFGNINDAIAREKQLKGWRREQKIALIKTENPKWRDLSHDRFD